MSKVSQEQARLNRARVVATAAKMFRERGFDGVGIADVMKSAGLTHGGFYAQFPSKEHLMAEASGEAWEQRIAAWQALLEGSSQKNLSTLASVYVSKGHLQTPGDGCVATTL